MLVKAQSVDGRDYRTGQPIRILIENDLIVDVLSLPSESLDDHLPWVAPGLVDLQVNGYAGFDFNGGILDEITLMEITGRLWSQGVTEFLPTLITNHRVATLQAVHSIRMAIEASRQVSQSIAGIHLEGPFISPLDGPRGAHDQAYVTPPDWDFFQQLQEAAGGRIRLITLSPEWDHSTEFIRKCLDSGVRVAIGHTAATTVQIQRAIEAGATLSTHLGNGTHPMIHRHPNYIWDQLASDELWASFIADGFHLPPAVIKVILRVKGNHAFIISDSVSLTGLPPGNYRTQVGGEVVLSDEGKLYLAEQPELLAGSAKTLIQDIGNLVQERLCTWSEAWDLGSVRPARYLGLDSKNGIQVGGKANIVFFVREEQNAQVVQTICNGRIVYMKS